MGALAALIEQKERLAVSMHHNDVVGLISPDATWEAYAHPRCMLASPQEGMAVKASPTSSADDVTSWAAAGELLPVCG